MEFPLAGYRPGALDVPPLTQYEAPLQMYLHPDAAGNAPNVDVTIHPNVKSLTDYVAAEKRDISAKGLKLISEKLSPADVWTAEYAGGSIDGKKLHFYRRDIFVSGNIYRALAFARDSQWPDAGSRLKACVDSFELISPTSAPGSAPSPGAPAKLEFPHCGFRISPLDDATVVDGFHYNLQMILPVPNTRMSVSVMIIPYAKSMAEFIAETKQQHSRPAFNDPLVSDTQPSPNTWAYQDRVRYYSRAIVANGKLYLAQAQLTKADQPPENNAKLKACVDSFEVLPPPSIPPSPTPSNPGQAAHPSQLAPPTHRSHPSDPLFTSPFTLHPSPRALQSPPKTPPRTPVTSSPPPR